MTASCRTVCGCRGGISPQSNYFIVFRVRWINARAGVDRSNEEIAVLQAEMGMIHRGYQKMAEDWATRARVMEAVEDGEAHVASACAQEEIWLEFADRARIEFNRIVPGVVS